MDEIDRREEVGIGEETGVVRVVEADFREPNESHDEANDEELVDVIVSVGEDTEIDEANEEEAAAMQALQEFRLAGRRTRATSDRP